MIFLGIFTMAFSAPVAQDLQLLHHHEPRLRWASRAAGQLEGALSHGGDDGAGLRHLTGTASARGGMRWWVAGLGCWGFDDDWKIGSGDLWT